MAQDDEDTRAILSRRNRFIAIALAGMTTAACGSDPEPQACLSQEVPEETNGDETPEVPPQPCLSPPPTMDEPDPQPCLSIAAPDDES